MEREARLNSIESFVQILKVIDELQMKLVLDKEHFFNALKNDNLSDKEKEFAEDMILENDQYCAKCEETKAIINLEMFKLVD